MPIDKIKHLEKFPTFFPFPLLQGLGKWPLLTTPEKAEAISMARKYRAFIKSLRLFSLHRLHYLLAGKSIKTQVSHYGGYWILYIIVKEKFEIPIENSNRPPKMQ
jgi:hypothetical protein